MKYQLNNVNFGERYFAENYVAKPHRVLVDYRTQHLLDSGIDVLEVTDRFTDWCSNDQNRAYFPKYLFEILDHPLRQRYNMQRPRPYFLSCLNRIPRIHKAKIFLALQRQPWRYSCQISWANMPSDETNVMWENLMLLESQLSVQDYQQLIKLTPTPLTGSDYGAVLGGWYYTANAATVHRDCYVDLVVENSLVDAMVTEKTWKPMLSGQLFLILGATGIVEHLRQIGLDVFDDCIDHSYDLTDDPDEKVRLLVASADKLRRDIKKIWRRTYHRRLKNYFLIQSSEFHNRLLNDLSLKAQAGFGPVQP